jgi:uncharacterized membrane protein YjfL (UPF0719 family)
VLDYLRATLTNVPPAAASLLLTLLAGGLLWFLHNRLTRFDDHRVLFHDGNVAYLVQRAALMLGFGIAALPPTTRTATDLPWSSLLGQAYELVWVVVAFVAVRYVVDLVLLRRVANDEELIRGNVALGVVEAGFYVGFGFILNGSLTGASPTVALGLASTVVFGCLGLALVVAVFWLHEAVTPWSIRDEVQAGGLTAAFEAAGVLIAVGIVVHEGVAGDFTGWVVGFEAFTVTAVVAVVTLYLFRWLANRLLLRGLTLATIQSEHRVVASAFGAVVMVVVAVLVAAVVRTQL